jgi:hypothetical protein
MEVFMKFFNDNLQKADAKIFDSLENEMNRQKYQIELMKGI